MKNFRILSLIALLVVFALTPAFAQQNNLTQTSLSAAITASQTKFNVASATGITAGKLLFIDREAVRVSAISSTTVTVSRGTDSTAAVAHISGAMVLAGSPDWFYRHNPSGACTQSATFVKPWLNIATGQQWLCSTISAKWVAGFGNTAVPAEPTTAVASAAGLVTPSGPLFHVTGTAAITGFNIPVGFDKGVICAIPDGIFTTTAANNIALASTGVVSKQLCWNYDGAAAKPFFPSY